MPLQQQQLKKQQQLKRRINKLVLVLLLIAAGLNGCSGKSATKPAASAAPKVQGQAITSSSTGTATALLGTTEDNVYMYNPQGRRDPFAPIIERETKKSKSGERPPLERYNLTELKLSGVVWGGFGYNAMIEGPDGKGYFVRTGALLGPNRGVVKKITQNQIIVEEKFKNYTGETERKEIIIELRKKQEGKP